MKDLGDLKIAMLGTNKPHHDDGKFYCEGVCDGLVFGTPKVFGQYVMCVPCWEIAYDEKGMLLEALEKEVSV